MDPPKPSLSLLSLHLLDPLPVPVRCSMPWIHPLPRRPIRCASSAAACVTYMTLTASWRRTRRALARLGGGCPPYEIKNRCLFCPTVAPQGIWGCPGGDKKDKGQLSGQKPKQGLSSPRSLSLTGFCLRGTKGQLPDPAKASPSNPGGAQPDSSGNPPGEGKPDATQEAASEA
jgi:hypothetical protein